MYSIRTTDIGVAVENTLRELREKRGWFQEELGFESGLHRNDIGGVERGERNIAIVNLATLARHWASSQENFCRST